MTPSFDFLTEEERALGDRFRRDGFIVAPAEDRAALDAIRDLMVGLARRRLGMEEGPERSGPPGRLLDRIGDFVSVEALNAFRLAMIGGMNAEPWLRAAYFSVARRTLSAIVGSELCMQRRVNLSIQLPDDDSSLLPVHADTWSGDSPFEVVLWIPLVDCHGSKSMFLLPPGPNAELERTLHRFADRSVDGMFAAIEPDLTWMEVPYGHFLLFNQNLAHGNRVNREADARWSMNCRFKGVFTPYADKKLGEFFEPITLRPASRIGLDYEMPAGFHE
ncbi:sporadic carbohydrate cluster 2OG-Fe(II) oxygenase [Azospirillum brasilense]|uniref:Sporadic carbohydrate cluster 2OG-Fe(II) oxygenase n=1 Tax=Azospirillum brasilense TaxID=192 RepID=A0A560AKZ5_AZOBR|nr:sporadic carbohydrate cluster 2OG-Fe(II) oxygenase [Azospirillum brasilense]TWA61045.1 sporadic carbohydrate cluster 2OG-Fe(II) oxygenase [Azospirillum brasilense]